MRQYFLVLGYGVPKNIFKDENYHFYLKTAFNHIFDWCAMHDQWDPVIIFSGGRTDLFKPFRRTEAQEMIKFFTSLAKRQSVKSRTKKWTLVPETKSFSTLDNLLYASDITRAQHSGNSPIIILGEQTRHRRIQTLSKKIFAHATMVPIDFDQSANRYLDPSMIRHRESEALKLDLWALQSPHHLKEHRKLYHKKFVFLRSSSSTKHVDAITQWWKQELNEFKKKSTKKDK